MAGRKASGLQSSTGSTHWGLGLESSNASEAIRWLTANCFAGRQPVKQTVSYERVKSSAHWLQAMCDGEEQTRAAYFTEDSSDYLIAYPSGTVIARFPFSSSVKVAVNLLETAPFEVASFETIHPDWNTIDRKYKPPSFSRNHFKHGWGCAFKAVGHDRLVSRRWLEFGPWQLHKGASDLTLLQFHDLNANAIEALAQAKLAHAAIGIGDAGGYLQIPYEFNGPIRGLYDAKEKQLRIPVFGRKLKQTELLDVCAALKQGTLTAEQPLNRVAYVFPGVEDAQPWIHALWLRAIECWVIIDGIERRIDTDYRPVVTPPAWVAAT